MGWAPPGKLGQEVAFKGNPTPSALSLARRHDRILARRALQRPEPVTSERDPDGDGLLAANDRCPDVPEDIDRRGRGRLPRAGQRPRRRARRARYARWPPRWSTAGPTGTAAPTGASTPRPARAPRSSIPTWPCRRSSSRRRGRPLGRGAVPGGRPHRAARAQPLARTPRPRRRGERVHREGRGDRPRRATPGPPRRGPLGPRPVPATLPLCPTALGHPRHRPGRALRHRGRRHRACGRWARPTRTSTPSWPPPWPPSSTADRRAARRRPPRLPRRPRPRRPRPPPPRPAVRRDAPSRRHRDRPGRAAGASAPADDNPPPAACSACPACPTQHARRA